MCLRSEAHQLALTAYHASDRLDDGSTQNLRGCHLRRHGLGDSRQNAWRQRLSRCLSHRLARLKAVFCWESLPRCTENATVPHRLPAVFNRLTTFPTVCHSIPPISLYTPMYPTVYNALVTIFRGMPPTSHGVPTTTHSFPQPATATVMLPLMLLCFCKDREHTADVLSFPFSVLLPPFRPSRVGNRESPDPRTVNFFLKVGTAAFRVDDEMYMVSRFR